VLGPEEYIEALEAMRSDFLKLWKEREALKREVVKMSLYNDENASQLEHQGLPVLARLAREALAEGLDKEEW